MIAFLHIARTYWKPALAILIAAWIYHVGYSSAQRICNTANLNAEITELKRQNEAKKNILAQAEKDRQVREFEITNLTKKVTDYESNIGKQNSCSLSTDDAKRLHAIR